MANAPCFRRTGRDAEKQRVIDEDSTALFESAQFVPMIFEEILATTLDGVVAATEPLRRTLRRQIETGRILPQFESGGLVPAAELYTYLTGLNGRNAKYDHLSVGEVSMSRAFAIFAISVLSGNLFAQVSPTTREAPQVRIIEGPKIELVKEYLTIISWTTNNPGGSPVHFGVVHYGTDLNRLIETAKSPIRLNPDHPSTIFRVRLDNLRPQTTYYYTVDSMQASGKRDGVKSLVNHFTTP